jgi:hypothetical protein
MDINNFSHERVRARLLSLLLPTHACPRIFRHSRLAYPTAHASPWFTCGASRSRS